MYSEHHRNREDTVEDNKINQNRLRLAAARQGYRLSKSRRRDPRALDFGLYWLTDQSGRVVISGDIGAVARKLGDQA